MNILFTVPLYLSMFLYISLPPYLSLFLSFHLLLVLWEPCYTLYRSIYLSTSLCPSICLCFYLSPFVGPLGARLLHSCIRLQLSSVFILILCIRYYKKKTFYYFFTLDFFSQNVSYTGHFVLLKKSSIHKSLV